MSVPISWVTSATDNQTRETTAEATLQAIRTGGKELKTKVESIRASLRSNGDKKAVAELKKQLPAMLWSGTFTQRANDKLVKHSGLLCADLDGLNGDLRVVNEKLRQSPHAYAVFISPSGEGLKAVFRVSADAAKHAGSFRAVERHVRQLTGKQIDQACKDPARLCFLSYDPDVYHNADAREITPLPALERTKFDASPVAVNTSERQRIAAELLGEIDWKSETSGYCVCPGKHLHTNSNGERDCEVHLDNAPTVHCFHNSCAGIIAGVNHELRSRIGKAETPNGTCNVKAPKQQSANPKSPRQLNTVQLSSVEMLPINFVDKPLFQANAFHLLVGKKNSGKGTFLSSVASRFTRGELGEKRNVIWIAAGEDSLSLDVRPRIEAAGGDTGRVYCTTDIPTLPWDIPALRERIKQIGDVALIVLDPISGMLGGRVNTNLDNDVRHAIAPLNELADAERCLVIGVRHLKKDASQGALDSVLGSSDWVNIPRAVLAMAMDNEDEEMRHVQVVAGNRVPRGTASRSFRIVGVDIVKGGESVAKAEFLDGAGKDVDEMLSSNFDGLGSKTKTAKIGLLDLLDESGGNVESDTATTEITTRYSVSIRTVQSAKTWLKENGLIAFSPDKDENGKVRRWTIRRTNVPRPANLQGFSPHGTTQYTEDTEPDIEL